MRVDWRGVAAVAALSIVWGLAVVIQRQHEIHFVSRLDVAERIAATLETVRDLLRWIAFAAALLVLRCVVLLCVRNPP